MKKVIVLYICFLLVLLPISIISCGGTPDVKPESSSTPTTPVTEQTTTTTTTTTTQPPEQQPTLPPTQPESSTPNYLEFLRCWKFSNLGELSNSEPIAIVQFLKDKEGVYDKDPYMGKPFISYNLLVEGLPQDKVYDCWIKTIRTGKPTKPVSTGLKIDTSGYVTTESEKLGLALLDYAKGEAMEVLLMTEDKTITGYGIVIPYPIEARLGQCHVWVQCLTANKDTFVIWGEGFEPNEDIDVTGNSEGEILKFTQKADSNGLLGPLVMLPAVIGKTSGSATYTLVGKAGALPVSFDWVSPTQ